MQSSVKPSGPSYCSIVPYGLFPGGFDGLRHHSVYLAVRARSFWRCIEQAGVTGAGCHAELNYRSPLHGAENRVQACSGADTNVASMVGVVLSLASCAQPGRLMLWATCDTLLKAVVASINHVMNINTLFIGGALI